MLLECFPTLQQDDIKGAVMGEGGADIKLSPLAQEKIPYKFEAKNQERVNIWGAYAQAKEHGGDGEPVLIIKKNQHHPLVLLDATYFIKLIGKKGGNQAQ